jgi:hypothetical protein
LVSDIFVGVHIKCAHAHTYKRREEMYLVIPSHRLPVIYLKETDWEGLKYHTRYFKRFECIAFDSLYVHMCELVRRERGRQGNITSSLQAIMLLKFAGNIAQLHRTNTE